MWPQNVSWGQAALDEVGEIGGPARWPGVASKSLSTQNGGEAWL